ncbi:hypothetical protein BN871_IP_00040 [Paenibacillus sp. P22]|nr:hypothetical protein BN871_IP_00040 [Paenibacillus sp. P22]
MPTRFCCFTALRAAEKPSTRQRRRRPERSSCGCLHMDGDRLAGYAVVPHFLAGSLRAADQLGNADEFIALAAELVDDNRKRFVGLLHGIARMKQHDIAGMGALEHSIDNVLGSDIHPVLGIGVPLDDLVAQAFRNLKHPFVKIPVGEADELGCFSRLLGKDGVGCLDLILDFFVGQLAVVFVLVAVAADFPAAVNDGFDDLRMGLRPGRGEEERSVLDVFLFKDFKDGLGPLFSPADIEGQSDDFFACRHIIDSGRLIVRKHGDLVLLGIDDTGGKNDGHGQEEITPDFSSVEYIKMIHR